MASGPVARFDDAVSGESTVFRAADEVLWADEPADVVPVLREVERRSAQGWWAFGFVAYEAAPAFDPSLTVRAPVPGLPLVWFGLARRPVRDPPVRAGGLPTGPVWSLDWTEAEHAVAVARVREKIAAGTTYQVNLTTRLQTSFDGESLDLYGELLGGQRTRYGAHLDLGRFAIASVSPELFFRVEDSRILLRPMKGTTARGRNRAEDAERVLQLSCSAKERAENLMIVDLMRNDVSRIARSGSVRVPVLGRVERYDTVLQMTSDVTARLRAGVGLPEIFTALFPCGSVTGAPKGSTMRLIAELEQAPRGVYTGAIGVVPPKGSAAATQFSVGIRTVLVDRVAGVATYGVGGGVTWPSEVAAEYRELVDKARVLEVRPDFHLIETMRCVDSSVRSLNAHLDRIEESAAYFGFSFSRQRAEKAVLARAVPSSRIRLRCYRDGSVGVDVEPLPEPFGRPVRVVVDSVAIDSRACWPQHKTSRREPYSSALARHPEADDVLLVNERGELTESCTANLAVQLDGRWCTPPLGDGCLPGIERARLVRSGELAERILRPGDLAGATGLALVNSLRGWRPAALI